MFAEHQLLFETVPVISGKGIFEVLGGLGPRDLLGGTGGAWLSGFEVKFLVLLTWLSGPICYPGLIIKLLVSSKWISVSLVIEFFPISKISGFITSSGPSSLMSILTTFWLSLASFWSWNVKSKRRSFSAFLDFLVNLTTFLSLNTTFVAGAKLRVSLSCNGYAVLLLS